MIQEENQEKTWNQCLSQTNIFLKYFFKKSYIVENVNAIPGFQVVLSKPDSTQKFFHLNTKNGNRYRHWIRNWKKAF